MLSQMPHGGDSCDFCNGVSAHRKYPCKNFFHNGRPVFQSKQGLWVLCNECSALVDAGKWAKLAERAYSSFLERNTVPRYDAVKLRAQFSDLVHLFAMHRIVGH